MSSLVLTGDTSGQVTLAAPAVAGSNTITLQAATATSSVNTLSTAVATTSGTSVTFSSIPSWVKRITMMLSGVSTSGTSVIQAQLGSGSATTTGYNGNTSIFVGTGTASGSISTGFAVDVSNASITAASTRYGHLIFTNISGNTWVASGVMAYSGSGSTSITGGNISLSGVLDRVILTTVNGTDTFDAGSVNILYEG